MPCALLVRTKVGQGTSSVLWSKNTADSSMAHGTGHPPSGRLWVSGVDELDIENREGFPCQPETQKTKLHPFFYSRNILHPSKSHGILTATSFQSHTHNCVVLPSFLPRGTGPCYMSHTWLGWKHLLGGLHAKYTCFGVADREVFKWELEGNKQENLTFD